MYCNKYILRESLQNRTISKFENVQIIQPAKSRFWLKLIRSWTVIRFHFNCLCSSIIAVDLGGMAERLIAPVLKTGDAVRHS